MRTLRTIFLFLLVFITQQANSEPVPVIGGATFYDTTGAFVLKDAPITGELDLAASTATFSSFDFFGISFITTSVELLEEGTHTRPADPFGGPDITATVESGQVGAYVTIEWGINVFSTLMVWDVLSHSGGTSYTTTDSDGDGIPGHAFVTGPFPGFSLVYDFNEGEPPPDVEVVLNIDGGNTQECSETGGSTMSLSAEVTLIGSAELSSVEWYINGESAGSGSSITPFLTLGLHEIEVVATITEGFSDTDTATVEVRDTTAPLLDVAFLNQAGMRITTISAGRHVSVHIQATDTCDPAPLTEGAAVPVFAVKDGDSIKIQQGGINTVDLPTTAVELSASATDASGNRSTGTAILTITD